MGYSIFIQKYKITDFAKIADTLPLGGTKADQVKDADGKNLDPLPGMSYEITRVTPIQGASGFEPVQGDGAFQITVTTDEKGLAHAENLVQGMYQIVEKEHAQLKDVMGPVIVELLQTSGNIGTAQVLLWILAMIIAMGGFGLLSIHRKKDVF